MPELPELEALARSMSADLPSPLIEAVAVWSPSIVKTVTPAVNELAGDQLVGVWRRGKWLLFATAAGRTLAVHLMTGGRLRRAEADQKSARGEAFTIGFAGGSTLRLAEIGSKKRSGVYLSVGDGQELVAHLGPEPLADGFGVEALAERLAGPGRQLKTALTDQRTLAGLGNAWSDEVLHAARLSPLLMTNRLTIEQIGRLHAAIRRRLVEGIDQASIDNYLEKLKPDRRDYLRVHNRKGEPCPACQTRLAAIHFSERATTYCPSCQSAGRVFADRRLSRLLR